MTYSTMPAGILLEAICIIFSQDISLLHQQRRVASASSVHVICLHFAFSSYFTRHNDKTRHSDASDASQQGQRKDSRLTFGRLRSEVKGSPQSYKQEEHMLDKIDAMCKLYFFTVTIFIDDIL